MILSHRIALRTTKEQDIFLSKACGTARLAYNWALDEWGKQYKAWKEDNTLPKPSVYSISREFNAIKREKWPWITEVSHVAPATAILSLGNAFKNFWAGRAKYPTFKAKNRSRDSFGLPNDKFRIEGKFVRLPKLGMVRMCEPLRFSGKIMRGTISRTADRWFISIAVETSDKDHLYGSATPGTVGVDVGVKDMAVLSDGRRFSGPKPHKAELKRLRRLSRSLSRKQRGRRGSDGNPDTPPSQNYIKARKKLAKLHAKITNVRNDAMHKLTHTITNDYDLIGIETLNVSGMIKNRKLSRAVSDMGMYEFRRQLEYKTNIRGSKLVLADKWFPSSKTCSECGEVVEKLPLSVRTWTCDSCGTTHDRDINAAINLKKYAAK